MSLADPQWSPTSAQVTVLQARGLRIKGKSGTNDAYAVMHVGKEKFQTSVVEKSVIPVWKEEATFDLPPTLHQGAGGGGGGGGGGGTLQVQVLHRALVGPDKLLGQANINLLDLSEDKTRKKTEWFKLLDKTGKHDKDRGEVLVDIQFLRNNMTTSMFDLSAAGKSRSRLGKFKDKVRGKKKESDALTNAAPAFSQVLTDSEEEGLGDVEVPVGKDEKKKVLRVKSLFSPKSNLQKNMSQSMSVLPAKNSSLSGSQSYGLNSEASEGKKKFKFSFHKRSGSDNKDASSHQKHVTSEQSNLCINGSHIYCEEPQPRTSRIGSNYSIASSGHGSMEDVPDSSPPSVDSLRAVRQYSPWTEEEEEGANVEGNKKGEESELGEQKDETLEMEEERRRKEEKELERLAEERVRREEEERIKREEEENRVRRQEEEIKRLAEEKRRKEEDRRRNEEAKLIKEEEERQRREEEERVKREEEEHERLAEEKRRLKEQEFKKKEEEEQQKREEEERKRLEEERVQKERRRREEEERQKREEEERIRLEEERVQKERRRREEEERQKREEERIRLEEERAQEERRRREEEERQKREEERIRLVEERAQEERRRREEEERQTREEEERIRLEEERAQEERRRREEEVRQKREEEERIRLEEERVQEERKRREEEEVEERKRLEEERVQEERREKEEEERARRLEKERKLEEEKRKQEEEDKRKLEEEDKRRIEEEKAREEVRIKLEEQRRKEEEEKMRRQKEEEKRKVEEQERRQREEEETIRNEEEVKRLKEEYERLLDEKKKLEEEERKRTEEEEKKREEEEERKRLEEECRRLEEDRRLEEERRRIEEEKRWQREEEERVRREKEEYERQMEEERKRTEEEEKERKEEQKRIEEEERKKEEEERIRKEKKENERLAEEAQKREREERIRKEKEEGEARKLEEEKREEEEQKKKKCKTKKAAGRRVEFAIPEEVTSTNPFDENYSLNPFEEISCSPSEPDRCTSSTSTNEKDLGGSQREKRAAPQPPGRPPADRHAQKEQDAFATRHVAQINKQSKDKDAKQSSLIPKRSVKKIAPVKAPAPGINNTQTATQSSPTKGTVSVVKPGKRIAPPRPVSSEIKPPQASGGNISETEQEPIGHSLNPFEDDEAENERAAQDDTTISSKSDPIQWPPHVSEAAEGGTSSQNKIKSSKIVRAPLVPAATAATPSTLIDRSTDGGLVTDKRKMSNSTKAQEPKSEAKNAVIAKETAPQESQHETVRSAKEDAGGKNEEPPAVPRRLQPVKPLNALEQQPNSVANAAKEISTEILCEVQEQTKVKDTALKGSYSQLTQQELISMVLKQETLLTERDEKISQLEQYIDNLLVRVIEEAPTILMSINSLKKAV